MRQANEHLKIEELLRALYARARPEGESFERELEEHLGQCESCARLEEEYRHFMSKLYEFGKSVGPGPGGPCPAPAVWAELAAGLIAQETAFQHLEHAASCLACAEELQHAMYAVSDNSGVPDDLQQKLTTSTEQWQRGFAEKIAAQQGPFAPEKSVPPVISLRGSSPPFLSLPWSRAAMAAVLVLAVGLGLFFWLRRGSPDTLIRQAYVQQRTIEMRIPGAGYGPVQVQRANGRSQISSPRALLEAEVLIKGGLEKSPGDAELLRQKAEADLLTWNYQPAIETLNHAARIHPDSFALLVDLATAYFERAEATASPADYEAGLQYLGDAIKLEPSNPAALFNRAILYERLYFYDRAIADWEQFLKIEQDPGWKAEAEKRLQDLRARQKDRSAWQTPEKLTLARFRAEVAAGHSGIEEYVEAAERKILPGISTAAALDENYQTASALAEMLKTAHSDRFLSDLLLDAGHSDFHEAAQMLGRSSVANHSGHFEDAYSDATRSAALFRSSGNSAGWLASQFEQAYALQFESRAGECRELTGQASGDAHRLHYAIAEVQLLLEHSICLNMAGEVGPAKDVLHRALSIAKDHGYTSYYLRGLTVLAALEADAGNDSIAWSAIQEGLGLYWKSGLPPVRAYSLYTVLDQIAERLGHAHVQCAALSEALGFRGENSNRLVEAAQHARLGDAALRLGDLPVAEKQLSEAESIFSAEPQTESVRWRRLEARIRLACVQSLRGADAGRTAATLLDSLPEVQHLSNRYVQFQYYDTLAGLKIKAGDAPAARHFLEEAITIAESGARSLSTWPEKLTWMEQHRQPFLRMTMLLLDSNQPAEALAQWERYRSAGQDAQPAPVSWRPPLTQTRIITYAFSPTGLVAWVRDADEVHSVSLQLSPREVRRTAENFISECSRPDSDISDLRADAQSLYHWLITPILPWLPREGHLIVEPDGVLGELPLEALVDDSGKYMGTRYTITVALTVKAGFHSGETVAVPSGGQALIVAAPAAAESGLPPPPGALREARRVAALFSNPSLLVGREAGILQVERQLDGSTIFHFAGHAGTDRGGAAILLADGALDMEGPGFSRPHRLSHLQLAVFSACATARPSELSESRSLVSEFLQAGAHNVVASRWNIDSMATADFVEMFYGSALSGHSVGRALQDAAGAFRHDREKAHPYYWAAFSVYGSA